MRIRARTHQSSQGGRWVGCQRGDPGAGAPRDKGECGEEQCLLECETRRHHDGYKSPAPPTRPIGASELHTVPPWSLGSQDTGSRTTSRGGAAAGGEAEMGPRVDSAEQVPGGPGGSQSSVLPPWFSSGSRTAPGGEEPWNEGQGTRERKAQDGVQALKGLQGPSRSSHVTAPTRRESSYE